MALTDAHGLPIAVRTFSASPNEVILADRTIRSSAVKPKRVIADRAYDSDKLRGTLAKRGIRLISPHRRNRTKAPTQDGRTLRRYCRRWKVERLFSWLFNWRRTVVRYEFHTKNYLGFVQLACIMLLCRQFF
jgi:transposase